MAIKPFSFTFHGKNSRDDFGILANSYDFLLPEKRARKQQIPFRNGSYDYGAHWYNERTLRLRCVWVSVMLKKLTRADIREISYWLSQKGRITLDIEPEKHYYGELYESNELVSHYDYAHENNINITGEMSTETTAGEFILNFICEPFAYGRTTNIGLTNGLNRIDYKGTAETPCVIILKNNNNFALNNVQVIAKRRNI